MYALADSSNKAKRCFLLIVMRTARIIHESRIRSNRHQLPHSPGRCAMETLRSIGHRHHNHRYRSQRLLDDSILWIVSHLGPGTHLHGIHGTSLCLVTGVPPITQQRTHGYDRTWRKTGIYISCWEKKYVTRLMNNDIHLSSYSHTNADQHRMHTEYFWIR